MKSVLIVDDSTTLRRYLKIVLETDGYKVLEASNGMQGYKHYKNNLPDFVITDILMPDMDGIELINKLIKEFPEIKIIVISDGGSFTNIPYFEICKKIGVSYCLKKPIQKDELLNILADF